MPASIFSVVDLPAPFGPTNATRSPAAIANETRSTATSSRLRGATSPRSAPARPRVRSLTRNTFERDSSSMTDTAVSWSKDP